MARKLRNFTNLLSNYVNSGRRIPMPVGAGYRLPPPVELHFRRGEALLVNTFFDFLERTATIDPAQQLQLWHTIIENGHNLIDLIQRIGLHRHFDAQLAPTPERSAYIAWCIFLGHLRQEDDPRYLQAATTNLYRHYLAATYPSKTAGPTPARNADALREKALRKLRKAWGHSVELKESFRTDTSDTGTGVDFALRLKTPRRSWITLLEQRGERLKPTRLKAYQSLLNELKAGRCRPQDHPGHDLPVVLGKSKGKLDPLE